MIRWVNILLTPTVVVVGFMAPNLLNHYHRCTSTTDTLLHPSCQYLHSSVISPSTILTLTEDSMMSRLSPDEELKEHHPDQAAEEDSTAGLDLEGLCRKLNASPKHSIRFESTPDDGVRGVYLNHAVKRGDIILSVPLSSCLTDDSVPSWMAKYLESNEDHDAFHPSGWAIRLASRWMDMKVKDAKGDLDPGYAFWLSLMPPADHLRASLPVHWLQDTIQNARCTALEVSVSSAQLARAEAIDDLADAMWNYYYHHHDQKQNGGHHHHHSYQDRASESQSVETIRTLCDEALDIVQTRSCRLERTANGGRSFGPPIRALVPIFDMINHGSAKCRGEFGANANFGLEGGGIMMDNDDVDDHARVVVRAMRDLRAGEEILIDYGASARPAWKCLLSYGFVPRYNRIPAPGETMVEEDIDDDDDDDENIAEVYMDGVRYEVGPSSIPVDMVAAAAVSIMADSGVLNGHEALDDDVALTPDVSMKLARRISDVAYHLLLEPEQDMYDDHPAATPTPFQVISNRLAAALRWSDHRVLMACAWELMDAATEETSYL